VPTQLTTRAQVNGYRFLLKRLEHALIRRDVRMLHDPLSIQVRSLVVGAVLALLAVGACAVYGLIRPQGAVAGANIIVGKDTGALFVIRDGKLHPVLNLASARLVTGSSEKPDSVKESKLAGYPRGPMLGIPGAPSALLGSVESGSMWTLCDPVSPIAGVSTLVMAGRPQAAGITHPLGRGEALLVSSDDKDYLLYDGKSARVDPTDPAVARALRLDGVRARPIEAGLLNATVPVPALAAPTIPDAGRPGPVRGTRIGAVIEVRDINGPELFVVTSTGVQRISPFTAELIRDTNSLGTSDVTVEPPDAVAHVPVVDTLPVDNFPDEPPTVVSADPFPVSCVSWSRSDGDQQATLRLIAARSWPLPDQAQPVAMIGGETSGAGAVYVPPSSGEFVQATGIGPDSVRRDGLFYIADTGIRYGIPDAATAKMLGFTGKPKPAPWQIISQLVPGPELTRDAAMIAHDTLAASPDQSR
jgi:type VII secretion protein EccB